MMRYMLMICQDESTVKDAEEMRSDPEGFAWFEEMNRRGLLRGGAPQTERRCHHRACAR
jgi:hypothetical protein